MTAIRSEKTPATLTDALWARYRTNGDIVARAQLLDRLNLPETARSVG